jgi:DNA repair exonuclease SbcCD nuclease subunit
VSDIHIGVHQNSNQWYSITKLWAEWLRDELVKRDIRDIIVCGDFFHYRDEIAVSTIHFATDILNIWRDFNIIMLVGNHDAYYKDRSDVNSLSVLDGWDNISVVSNLTTVDLFGKKSTFCPWGTAVTDIPDSDVVFGHFEINSFKQTNFKVCSSGINTKDLLSKTNLVITGHFHLRDERKYKQGTILYLGNPFQMDFGDIQSVKGYYILDFDTLSYEFTENTLSPKHQKVYLSELAKLGRVTDETKESLNNSFVKFVIDRNISTDEVDLVIQKLYTYTPITINIDYAMNFNKYKLDENMIHDFSGIDVETAIEEFVNLMDIKNKKEVIDYTVELYHKCA